MSEHIPERERLSNQPRVGEVRTLIDSATAILEREVMKGNTKTYFDDPSEILKMVGLKAHGEPTPAVVAELDIDDGIMVIDKSHENVRNPYITLTLHESQVIDSRNYIAITALRIDYKVLYGLKDTQELPHDATATWTELTGDGYEDFELENDSTDDSWFVSDAETREIDRDTYEKFMQAIRSLE